MNQSVSRSDDVTFYENEIDKIKENNKRLRSENDRKESKICALNNKLSNFGKEINKYDNDSLTDKKQLEKEIKNHQMTISSLKKSESQVQTILSLTRRMFREVALLVDKMRNRVKSTLKSKTTKQRAHKEAFEMLNLDVEDLNEFLDPEAK